MDWKLYSFVVRGKIRREVLSALGKPKTPTEIGKETKISVTHVSRALRELKERGLVKCLTPKEKTGKVYAATTIGNGILEEIRRNE